MGELDEFTPLNPARTISKTERRVLRRLTSEVRHDRLGVDWARFIREQSPSNDSSDSGCIVVRRQ